MRQEERAVQAVHPPEAVAAVEQRQLVQTARETTEELGALLSGVVAAVEAETLLLREARVELQEAVAQLPEPRVSPAGHSMGEPAAQVEREINMAAGAEADKEATRSPPEVRAAQEGLEVLAQAAVAAAGEGQQ
jgi:hypothetical protein